MAILGVAAFFRLVWPAFPPAFFRDEADKGYTAWCLLRTGRDMDGTRWPAMVRSLKVYTTPAYQWLAMPTVALGGINETATRFPAKLLGLVAVITLFLLGSAWYGINTGLLSAGVLALSPWHLVFSRWANQGIILPAVLPLAVWLSATGLTFRAALLGGLCWLVVFHAYTPGMILAPLLVIACAGLGRPRNRSQWRDWLVGHLLCFALPAGALTGWMVAHPHKALGRAQAVAASEWGQIPRNWASHFSPTYLFLQGDANPRHSLPGLGVLYPWEAITVGLGIGVLLFRRRREDGLVGVWLLLASLPAALTQEGLPHALRSIAGIPAWCLLSAVGLHAILKHLRMPLWGVLALWVSAGAGALSLSSRHLPADPVSAAWELGSREVVHTINQQHQAAPYPVLFTGLAEYPYIHYLFYSRIPPEVALSAPHEFEHKVGPVHFLPTGMSVLPALGETGVPMWVAARPEEWAEYRQWRNGAAPVAVLPSGAKRPYWVVWRHTPKDELPNDTPQTEGIK